MSFDKAVASSDGDGMTSGKGVASGETEFVSVMY